MLNRSIDLFPVGGRAFFTKPMRQKTCIGILLAPITSTP